MRKLILLLVLLCSACAPSAYRQWYQPGKADDMVKADYITCQDNWSLIKHLFYVRDLKEYRCMRDKGYALSGI